MEIKWTRSATKHRISHDRSGYVARTAEVIFSQPAPAGTPVGDDRLVFLGADQDGVMLEVMAVETAKGLVIIHAMPIRDRYRDLMKGDDDG